MELEQQVCSLEPSKQLKDSGFTQDSLFMYAVANDSDDVPALNFRRSFVLRYKYLDYISAPASAELGEVLPEDFVYRGELVSFYTIKRAGMWEVGYKCGNDFAVIFEEEETEADARAKLLINLLENNLVEIPA